jgi:gamma-glutamyltranspeptidase / glutathione hydrolase
MRRVASGEIDMPRILLSLSLFFLAGLAASAQTDRGDRVSGMPHASRSPVIAARGMVCTSQPLASQVGLQILRDGGTAMDAAIAANAALGLMEPTGCGVGGDLFAIVYDAKTKKLYGYNGSGRSPRKMSLAELKKRLVARGGGRATKIPSLGALPVSVPGCVDAWYALHERFGHLPMSDLLAPATRYAVEGYPISQLVAYYFARNVQIFLRSSELGEAEKTRIRATFMREGRLPREGDLVRNPDLARLYRRLAKEGRAGFYAGSTAGAIAAALREGGGLLDAEDLAAHRGAWVEPLSVEYRGHRLWELPPNGQGLAALQMLKILEPYDLKSMRHNSAEYLHHLVEAKKLAFEDRARFYADPDFAKLPIEGLLSDRYAARRRALIISAKAAKTFDVGRPELDEGDTIYLCTADRWGNMVSLIQSNYRGMGSGIVPEGQGFVLQDRGELFSLEDGHPNVYAPGKRPFHTIIPAFVTKAGKPLMAYGVMGGSMQPQGHVQVLCNLVDFGMNVQEAGDAARFNHTGSSQPTGERMKDGGKLALESGVHPKVRLDLEARGHRIVLKGSFGGYQAILRDPETGVYFGASEMRKDGQAVGF